MQRARQHTTIPVTGGQGFTIIELLIVIIVITVLTLIATVSYAGVTQRAGDAVVQDGLRTLAQQVAMDYSSKGAYATSAAAANDGNGLKLSGGLQFDYTSDGTRYCMTVKNQTGDISYYRDSIDSVVRSGSCPPPVTLPAAAARYTMNGTLGAISGSIPDDSGNGRQLTGALGTRIAGKYGQGFRPVNYPLDTGASPVAKVNDSNLYSADTLTIAAWVNPWLNGEAERFLFGFTSGDGGDSMMCIWQRRVIWNNSDAAIGTFRVGGSLKPLTDDTTSLPVGSWTHIAMTYDKDVGGRLYINGSVVSTFNVTGSLNGASSFYVGNYGYEKSNADYDDVRVYKAALSAAQINLMMSGE